MKIIAEKARIDDIADAVRQKLNVETQYKLSEIPAAINNIYVGGELEPLSATANGDYTPGTGIEGFSRVHVNVSGGGGGADRSLMNYQFACNAVTNPCIIKEGGKWLSNFIAAYTFMRPAGTNGAILQPDWSQPFEIQIQFRITNTINRSMVLFGAEQGFCYCPSIEVSKNYDGIWCGFSTDGSSWTDALVFAGGSDISITLNTIIRINAVWDGTNYTVTVFDGTNTVTKSITPATAHYFSSAYNMEFGGINRSSQHNAQYVEIDLENTFIKQNHVMVWGCNAE